MDTTHRYYSIYFSFVTLFCAFFGKIFYNVTKVTSETTLILNLQRALCSAPRAALLPNLGEPQNVGEFVTSPLQCAEMGVATVTSHLKFTTNSSVSGSKYQVLQLFLATEIPSIFMKKLSNSKSRIAK